MLTLQREKGFMKGETSCTCNEQTQSMKDLSKKKKRDFKSCLLECGSPQELVNKIQAEVDISLSNNPLTKDILKHSTIYHHLQPRCAETQKNPFEELTGTLYKLLLTGWTNHSETFFQS